MKKLGFLLLALLVAIPSVSYGQKKSKFNYKTWRKGQSSTTSTSTYRVGRSSSGYSSSNGSSYGGGGYDNVSASGWRVITNHEDFKVSVLRSFATDDAVTVELLLENVGTQDVEVRVSGSNYETTASDDLGNYYDKDIYVKTSSGDLTTGAITTTLYPDAPLKATVRINGVGQDASVIKMLRLSVASQTWNLGVNPVRITNISIAR